MNPFSPFWFAAGVAATVLFWIFLGLTVVYLRQRRFFFLLPNLLLLLACYFLVQCAALYRYGARPEEGALHRIAFWVFSLPRWSLGLCLAGLAAAAALFLRDQRRFERSRITAMSVKEAMDNLPSGLCFYLPGGQVLLKNLAMERFCLTATGEALLSGALLRRRLFSGALPEGCEREMVGQTPVICLTDGTFHSVQEQEFDFENTRVHALMTADVTEQMKKSRSLGALQKKLTALSEQLVVYNREIVSLTAERELLSARVRLHDEMGADLLAIRRYMELGGSEADQRDIEARLRRNLTFLLTGQASQTRDEYELMLETAEKLGVRVRVTGTLPPEDPQKHVTATAIHECFTNTLRHARGDALDVTVEEGEDAYTVTFRNNGDQPAGPVEERGGLASLRSLTERIPGGRMEIVASPRFAVILTLPKEAPHEL